MLREKSCLRTMFRCYALSVIVSAFLCELNICRELIHVVSDKTGISGIKINLESNSMFFVGYPLRQIRSSTYERRKKENIQ